MNVVLTACAAARRATTAPQRKKHDDVAMHPQCAEFSRRIHDALKHVLVLCSTG